MHHAHDHEVNPNFPLRVLAELNGPLQALIAHCREAKPDLLLLLGPFVDSDQPNIRMGLVDQVYQDVFQEGVRHPLPFPSPLIVSMCGADAGQLRLASECLCQACSWDHEVSRIACVNPACW